MADLTLTLDDTLRLHADAIARQGVLQDMPTAGWATMTASCPHCGVEVQTSLEPARPYSALEMTPLAGALHTLRHSLFGHLHTYHPEVALLLSPLEANHG